MYNDIIKIMKPENSDWRMREAERLSLLGFLSILQPVTVLEIGVYKGGCTEWLCRFSRQVFAVDIEDRMSEKPANCTFFKMTSDKFFEEHAGLLFDCIIIDGEHTAQACRRDTINSIRHGTVILLHDTFNNDCRAGYKQAIQEEQERHKLKYVDLDFLPTGRIRSEPEFSNQKWDGMGIILT